MNTAVIKFDALTNAVGAATEHHNFAAFGLGRLVGFAKGAVVIRRLRLELGGTGIDQSVAAFNAQRHPAFKHLAFFGPHNVTDLTVGKTLELGLLHQLKRNLLQTVGPMRPSDFNQVLNLTQRTKGQSWSCPGSCSSECPT